jgi:hypothetical protein
MKIKFKDKIHKQAFIVSTIIIFGIFGAIAYSGYQEYGFQWTLLGAFPFAPIVLTISNIKDIK